MSVPDIADQARRRIGVGDMTQYWRLRSDHVGQYASKYRTCHSKCVGGHGGQEPSTESLLPSRLGAARPKSLPDIAKHGSVAPYDWAISVPDSAYRARS